MSILFKDFLDKPDISNRGVEIILKSLSLQKVTTTH